MAKKDLTDKQKLFLEMLFSDECQGDPVKAKIAAGYSENYSTTSLIESLEQELLAQTRLFLSRSGPKAAISMVGVLHDPTALGTKEKIVAAKDILDRIGLTKVDKLEVTGSNIFILPPIAPDQEIEDDA